MLKRGLFTKRCLILVKMRFISVKGICNKRTEICLWFEKLISLFWLVETHNCPSNIDKGLPLKQTYFHIASLNAATCSAHAAFTTLRPFSITVMV